MTSRPPLILVAPQTGKASAGSGGLQSSLSESYAAAIRAADGIPLILSCLVDETYVREVVGLADGILLTGGDDVDPALYAPRISQKLRATMSFDGPERDAFELLIIQETFRRRIPLMAICRGMQILNVALGGTLIADIPSEVPSPIINHRRIDAKESLVHEVDISPGSLFASAVGCLKMGVNSTHHQAVGRLAKVLQPSAVSRDGIVEGMELGSAHMDVLPYLLAVQFHPERLWARYREHLELFRSFTAACRRNRQ
jgi:putative glutamine amidotransferase